MDYKTTIAWVAGYLIVLIIDLYLLNLKYNRLLQYSPLKWPSMILHLIIQTILREYYHFDTYRILSLACNTISFLRATTMLEQRWYFSMAASDIYMFWEARGGVELV